MKMVVELTNLTDAPGKDPIKVSVYNRSLKPGQSLKLDASMVDNKIRALEKSGLISIGSVPSWYGAYKQKKGATLSLEEIKARLGAPRKEKKAVSSPVVTATVVEPEETVNVADLSENVTDLTENVDLEDEVVIESKPVTKKRRRKKKSSVPLPTSSLPTSEE